MVWAQHFTKELNLCFLREYCLFLMNCAREIGVPTLSGVRGFGGEKVSAPRSSPRCPLVPVLVYKALGH